MYMHTHLNIFTYMYCYTPMQGLEVFSFCLKPVLTIVILKKTMTKINLEFRLHFSSKLQIFIVISTVIIPSI